MNSEARSPTYQRCQELFDRAYPRFRNAGERYHDLVAELVTPQTRLLELGCGGMSLAAEPISRAGWRMGIDLDLPGLRENDLLPHLALADGGAIPLADASVDLIVSQWVVEHLEQPAQVFGEMARVLRPGGSIVLFTTNAWNYVPLLSRVVSGKVQSWLIETLLRRPDKESFPTFYRANSRQTLERLAQASGLQLEHCEFVGNPFYLAFSPALFRLALLFEKLSDPPPLRGLKLYLLAVLKK